MVTLSGKWVWIWNWRRCDGGDAGRVGARLRAAGCAGALVKAFDGAYWFDQGTPWREIARGLRENRAATGAWGYLYGRDPEGEARKAVETAQYGGADLLVLDVESEFKDRPEAAEKVCRLIRQELGPDYPVYFSSFAIARYHRSFPFETFRRACAGAAPQVYWNAFRWPVGQSLRWTFEDYAALGIPGEQVFPVGGLYQEGTVRFPPAEEVQEFIRRALSFGAPGVSFWSYEHMSEEMWQAIGAVPVAAGEAEMSSIEYQQVSRQLAELAARVDRLESAAGTHTAAPPAEPAPQPRTYVVRAGDTLSGIAARLGIGDWRRLHAANAGVIGPDPNLIYPGQVLVVP